MLQDERWPVRQVFYLVDQRAERRRAGLEAFEHVLFVVEAEMADAFDDDGVGALGAGGT